MARRARGVKRRAGAARTRPGPAPFRRRRIGPALTAALCIDRLVLVASTPVVDLFLWDSGAGLGVGENYLTLAAAGEVELPVAGALRGELRARSLRGRHRIHRLG
jgi:hypothetical protein